MHTMFSGRRFEFPARWMLAMKMLASRELLEMASESEISCTLQRRPSFFPSVLFSERPG